VQRDIVLSPALGIPDPAVCDFLMLLSLDCGGWEKWKANVTKNAISMPTIRGNKRITGYQRHPGTKGGRQPRYCSVSLGETARWQMYFVRGA